MKLCNPTTGIELSAAVVNDNLLCTVPLGTSCALSLHMASVQGSYESNTWAFQSSPLTCGTRSNVRLFCGRAGLPVWPSPELCLRRGDLGDIGRSLRGERGGVQAEPNSEDAPPVGERGEMLLVVL